MTNEKTFLFLGASNDDCEWMAGGLARVLIEAGHCVAFACSAPRERRDEYVALTHEARDVIGVHQKIVMPSPMRELNDVELTRMIGDVIDAVRPDACFIQPADDYMAHHMRFARASFQALLPDMRSARSDGDVTRPSRVSEIHAMECPSAPYPRVDFYMDVSEEIEDALTALMVYDKWNPGFGSGMAKTKRGLAMLRGALPVSRACEYAEGFKVVRAEETRISCLPELLGERFSAVLFPHGYGPPAY